MAGNNGEIRIKREIEDDDDPLSIVDGEYLFKKVWIFLKYSYYALYFTYWKHILLSKWIFMGLHTPQNVFVYYCPNIKIY